MKMKEIKKIEERAQQKIDILNALLSRFPGIIKIYGHNVDRVDNDCWAHCPTANAGLGHSWAWHGGNVESAIEKIEANEEQWKKSRIGEFEAA